MPFQPVLELCRIFRNSRSCPKCANDLLAFYSENFADGCPGTLVYSGVWPQRNSCYCCWHVLATSLPCSTTLEDNSHQSIRTVFSVCTSLCNRQCPVVQSISRTGADLSGRWNSPDTISVLHIGNSFPRQSTSRKKKYYQILST
ncbi:uncharacterized protein CIMG_12643 [Coccidioides immitis RS]|uniref:Uncharacterized protein n=1 Tax=Coccidioides immitis (strain RS) TaxID=246410 RepID=A0A0D8JUM3_COCIM|nr:uncharacterized protein CIMG_12643 [Coccidioides immitis RS]KJF59968.1 hypothetical protein CIMG_12643 [Coccidioides immitis RS]